MTKKNLPRCKTCCWWNEEKQPGKKGFCIYLDNERKPDDSNLTVVVKVADDHGLETWVKTGPDFGCVHHEETI